MRKIFSSIALFLTVMSLSAYTCGQQGPTPPSVTLTWVQGTPPTGYTIAFNCVYRGTAPGVYTIPALFCSTAPITSYLDSSVTRGDTYDYAVTATVKGLAESAYSNNAVAAVPAQPGGITPPSLQPPVDASLRNQERNGTVTSLVAKADYGR
jgi:hypothetical protein